MLIQKTSTLTGKTHKRNINVTAAQIMRWHLSGNMIQDAFPNLSADDREYLLTGITPEEWATLPPEE